MAPNSTDRRNHCSFFFHLLHWLLLNSKQYSGKCRSEFHYRKKINIPSHILLVRKVIINIVEISVICSSIVNDGNFHDPQWKMVNREKFSSKEVGNIKKEIQSQISFTYIDNSMTVGCHAE